MKNGKRRRRTSSHATERIELGRYIVADPAICHGKPTFKGTRIFVADVLADVERGLSWDWRRSGRVPLGAIAAAAKLAPSS